MITGPLCKAARALVEINRPRLAEKSGSPEDIIAEFEDGAITPPEATIEAIVKTLEDFGAMFVPASGALGAGVRLKFSRSVTKRIDILENEGGPARPDDVP
jgi:predicted transcriptional regulator